MLTKRRYQVRLCNGCDLRVWHPGKHQTKGPCKDKGFRLAMPSVEFVCAECHRQFKSKRALTVHRIAASCGNGQSIGAHFDLCDGCKTKAADVMRMKFMKTMRLVLRARTDVTTKVQGSHFQRIS